MSVSISQKAELFLAALEDILVADQVWKVSPNNAAWHCCQATEKIMKGYLRVLNVEYEYGHGHELDLLLEDVEASTTLTEATVESINYLKKHSTRLRYRRMLSDPTPEDARVAIARTRGVLDEFSVAPAISRFMDEAKEVHVKMLRANSEKYPD